MNWIKAKWAFIAGLIVSVVGFLMLQLNKGKESITVKAKATHRQSEEDLNEADHIDNALNDLDS